MQVGLHRFTRNYQPATLTIEPPRHPYVSMLYI